MRQGHVRAGVGLAVVALLLSVIGLSCRTGGTSAGFDYRHPQPRDYPQGHVAGTSSVQCSELAYFGDLPYDMTVHIGSGDLCEFELQEIKVNGRPTGDFIVYNESNVSYLRRANGKENLRIYTFADWRGGENLTVTVSGVDPKGKPVVITIEGKAPERKTCSNSLAFQSPSPEFPYFAVRATFNPANYESFRIESVLANGKAICEFRVFNDGMVLPGSKAERTGESNDLTVSGEVGFSVVFPYRWQAGDNVTVTVSGKADAGKVQEVNAGGNATSNGFWRPEWKYTASLVARETAGIPRRGEPVEATLGLIYDRVTDPNRELRVVTCIPGHPNADAAGYVELPCQVLEVTPWNDRSLIDNDEKDHETGEPIRRYMATTTVRFVFLADLEAYEKRVFLVCYGNPDATAPEYKTDLQVEDEGLGQTVSNTRYRMGLAKNSGAIETVMIKEGGPEILLEHKLETNGAVHWNPGVYSPPLPWVHASDWENPTATFFTGPVVHRVSKYADLPFIDFAAAHVTYEFFAGQPYMKVSTTMEIKKDIFVQALRNGEIVFNHAVLDEFVWKDSMGKIRSMKIEGTKKHPIHALEIPPDTPWMAFISRKAGVGFAGINVDYFNANLYGSPISQAQPYFYVQNGPWIYWSRGLVYPFGGLNFTRMMPVKKGSIYGEILGFLPFRLAEGAYPFAELEKYHTILTQPLEITEWIDLDPNTPKSWIMPLLTMPFDEGVDNAHSSREVPKK